jgi:hypothetical protein
MALGVGLVELPPTATNEERLHRLEQMLPLLEQRITQTAKQITEETAARVQGDSQELHERKQADADIHKLTEIFATGGLTRFWYVRGFPSRLDRRLQHLDLGTTMPCRAGEVPYIPEPSKEESRRRTFGGSRARSRQNASGRKLSGVWIVVCAAVVGKKYT